MIRLKTQKTLESMEGPELGEHFEKVFASYVETMRERHPVFIQRFQDAKGAGRRTANNAGDFVLVLDGKPILAELKSSTKNKNASESDLRVSQKAGAHAFTRAGGHALLFFLDSTGSVTVKNTLEVIGGDNLSISKINYRFYLDRERFTPPEKTFHDLRDILTGG